MMDWKSAIPHRDPMIWIDTVLEKDKSKVTTLAVLDKKKPIWRDDNKLIPASLVEFMAQTAIIFPVLKTGTLMENAFLVGIKNFNLDLDRIQKTIFREESHLEIRLNLESKVAGVLSVTGIVIYENEKLAEGALLLYGTNERPS